MVNVRDVFYLTLISIQFQFTTTSHVEVLNKEFVNQIYSIFPGLDFKVAGIRLKTPH